MSVLLLKFLKKFIKVLISSDSPPQIAVSFALGAFMGLTPDNFFLSIIIVSLLFILNVNVSAGLVSAGLFSLFSSRLFPLAHKIGSFLLIEQTGLFSFWTTLYNAPILPFLEFNNTVMLGTLILALLAQLPIYFLVKKGIIVYRESLHEKLQKLKIIQTIKASGIGQWVHKGWRFFQ